MKHIFHVIVIVFTCVVPMVLSAQINWTERTIDGDVDYATAVYAADIDDDGDLDVIGTSYNADDIYWWENNNGIGTSWTKHNVDTNFVHAMSVYAADIDDDDDIDIIGSAAYTDNDVAWFENADGIGTTWIKHTIDNNFSNAFAVYAADINEDGYMDVLGAATQDDDITWWENTDGSGTSWIEHLVDGVFDGAIFVSAADIDGDDHLDVLGAAFNADDIVWWENADDTGITWIKHTVDGDFDYARSVYAADVNDDGYRDVLGAAFNAGDITWWENTDGSGTSWIEHLVDGDFDGAYSVFAADIDKNGDLDILGAAQNADDITWWENADDTGTTWIEHTIAGNFDGSRSVYAADIDGDEDIDVLGAAVDADDITWWESDLVILDVGMVSIDIPSTLPEDTTLYPQATVTNTGTDSISFAVICEIDPGAYTSTDSVFNLAPGDSTPVTFPNSFNFVSGFYTVTVYTQLVGDRNPANDTLEKVIEATGIAEGISATPDAFMFNTITINRGKTNIEFTLPEATQVNLLIYDAVGRLNRTVVSKRFSAGTHNLSVNLDLSAGVYFYVLKTELGRDIMKKSVLLK